MESFICAAIPIAFVSAWIGYAAGSAKEAATEGFFFGLLFGPLGVLGAFALDNRPQCKTCLGRVPSGAKKCLHCGEPFGRSGAETEIKRQTRLYRQEQLARNEEYQRTAELRSKQRHEQAKQRRERIRNGLGNGIKATSDWWYGIDSDRRFLIFFWSWVITVFGACFAIVYFYVWQR